MPRYFIELQNFTEAEMGKTMGLMGVSSLLSGLIVTGLSDRFGRKPVINLFLLVGIFFPLALLFLVGSGWQMPAMFLAYFMFGTVPIVLGVIPSETVPAHSTAKAIGLLAGAGGIGVILGRVGIGWTIDRLFAPYVAATIFAVTAGGCALLAINGASHAPVAAFLIGFALGAEVDLLAYLTSRYFGLRYYGFLYALVYAFFWIGIALGPAITGRLYDAFGDYQMALRMIVIMLLVGAAAAYTLPRFTASFD